MSDQQDPKSDESLRSTFVSSSSLPQHDVKNLQPNFLDDPSDLNLLPSFRDIRAKTLRALYGIQQSDRNHPLQLFIDKSPKGSVDEAIRPLVDLLNAHPSYATLSSCSGRIALYDPSAGASDVTGTGATIADTEQINEANQGDEEDVSSERDNVNNSGKGSGRWALSSHAQITAQQLIDILNESSSTAETKEENQAELPTLMFKHEPLLLHVAASTLSRAEKLLSLSLALGFRESGIVATPKRVTVAIRGVGLSLTVPLARQGPLRPSDEYLKSLVAEANQRFVANEVKLQRLYVMVQSELFVPADCDDTDCKVEGTEDGFDGNDCSVETYMYEAVFESLPKLGLWGHATVVVPILPGEDCYVYAFGGHGTGPDGSKSAARSEKIYCLERTDGRWKEDGWRNIDMVVGPVPSQFETGVINNIHLQHATLGPREGLAACLLPTPDNAPLGSQDAPHFVAIFGGRAGPAQPSDELLIYGPPTFEDILWKPTDVRGEPPAARWGHTFTALSGKNGRVAVLCGGRSARGMVLSCHVLSLIPPADVGGSGAASHSHFLWETVKDEMSLFQHVSVRLYPEQSDQDHDKLFIFGGNCDSANLFGSMLSMEDGLSGNKKEISPFVLTIDRKGRNHAITPMLEDEFDASKFAPLMCISSSGCYVNEESASDALFVVSGGVPSIGGTNTSALSLFRAKAEGNTQIVDLQRIPVQCRLSDDDPESKINVGALVRHGCLALPRRADLDEPSRFILVGGGMSSFAFGPTFSESYEVSFQPIRGNAPQQHISSQETSPMVAPNSDSTTGAGDAKKSVTDVVYVEKSKAKELKSELEKAQLLDKNYRMIPADASSAPVDDPGQYIAVPVSAAFSKMSPVEAISFQWFALIAGRGRQEMPFSTKVLGNRRTHR